MLKARTLRNAISFFIAMMMSIAASAQERNIINQLTLPPGFHIHIYAYVPGAREMAVANNGVVYVGTRLEGKVYVVLPNANETRAKAVKVLVSGLNQPNGVALYKGALYIGAVNKILKIPDVKNHLNRPHIETINDQLPDKSHHGQRYLRFSPDHWLYIGIGAPCNVCIPSAPIIATIVRMKPSGRDLQIYARGVRNSVGFDWNPTDQQLWFTDNGRDWLGDNLPPDELNVAPHANMNFGFPYFFGKNVPDPKFSHLKSPKGMTPAKMDLPAHVAPLGMSFYIGRQFPSNYRHNIFIAEHGSWNRSSKVGYRVMRVSLKGNIPLHRVSFVTGWLVGQKVYGRPVDIKMMPNGTMLISDDYLGVIYQVTYQKPQHHKA